MEQFHYLRYEQPVGEHLKYLVWAQGRPLACLAWSSAPRHLASRDRFIGWNGEARRRNIRFLAYNTRFLILPWVTSAPGFAHPRPHGPPDLAGLGSHLRAPDLFSGNLHRPGTIPRDLLSGGELDGVGTNHGARQRRSDASANRSIKEVLGLPLHRRFHELLQESK